MTLAGWIFMLSVWSVVTGLLVWTYWKILRGENSE